METRRAIKGLPAQGTSPPAIRPIRMGGGGVLRRGPGAPAPRQPAAEFRVQIYQHLLALLDMADKLSLDLFRQEDPYGLDWHGLARQVVAHYKADGVQVIQALRGMVMSKEGAQYLPKGLYRNFLEYLEACARFMDSARGAGFEEAAGMLTPKVSAADRAENPFLRACGQFKKATHDMQQHVCIFENERAAGEESFFA